MFYLSFFVLGSGLVGGWIGQNRKIGYWGGFMISVLLGFLGWIIAAYSPKIAPMKSTFPNNSKNIVSSSSGGNWEREFTTAPSGSDTLSKLNELKQNGSITETEFEELKNKLG